MAPTNSMFKHSANSSKHLCPQISPTAPSPLSLALGLGGSRALLSQARASDRMVIQIVPQRGTEPNGLADYASALARALQSHGVDSVFLSGTPCDGRTATKDEWKTISVPRRQSQSLADTLGSLAAATEAAAVLLHFSGYGYEKRGAPLWLLRG